MIAITLQYENGSRTTMRMEVIDEDEVSVEIDGTTTKMSLGEGVHDLTERFKEHIIDLIGDV